MSEANQLERIVERLWEETPKCVCGGFPGGLCENAYGCPEHLAQPRGEPMATAPKDGTEIEILFRHHNWRYAEGSEKEQWQEWSRAHWVDFNGGGWVWRGICGEPVCWRPVPPNANVEVRADEI